jgi:hypothetical protein
MSGMYGTVKPADLNIGEDVEVFYLYRPSFNSEDNEFKNFKKLDSATVLKPCTAGDNNMAISGLFTLKLPLNIFGKKGIYTIYIRPREIDAEIVDVGTLAAFPDIRGVVFNENGLEKFMVSNSMVGYRIEYMGDNNEKNGEFTIVTSNNKVSPMSYMLNNTSEKGTRYRYTMQGHQIFCTVTPSLAPTFKPNDLPIIGMSGQKVKIVNTKFNPLMLEIEMVEHDDETITYMLEGNQLIDKDSAIITTFNERGEIYHQSEYGAYKDEYGTALYEFKKNRDNIDFNQSLENLE